MKYSLKGNLRGFYCGDCSDALNNVVVRIYAHKQVETATLLAAASEKETFHQRSDEELHAISDLLLAEAKTDAQGNYHIELDDDRYDGGAFDIDFYCFTIPVVRKFPPKPPIPKAKQFNITTLQPQWQGIENENVFAKFDFELTSRWLCRIYALFDIWVVCGHVLDCETKRPLEGLKVTAFDCDWMQDDNLGFDYTDANGHFKIMYDGEKMRQTLLSPWFNQEYPAGPDYYFRIETASGDVLLQEDRSVGNRRDRANAPNCFCVDFCVDGGDIDVPFFTSVGNFNITTDIDASGKTIAARSGAGGAGFGFFGGVKLKGFANELFPGTSNPMFYRFRYSFDAVNWNNITEANLDARELTVGQREIIWNGVTNFQDVVIQKGVAATMPLDSSPVDAYPAPIPKHFLALDPQGWVRVDQHPRTVGIGFHGPLLYLDTNTIVSGGDANVGETVGANIVSPKIGRMVYIQFQTTDDPTDATRTRTQTQLANIYINNWTEVRLLELQELSAGLAGCTPVSTQAHVKYAADHEFLTSFAVGIWSNATGTIAGLPAGIGARGAVSWVAGLDLTTAGLTPPFPAGWPSCAYSLTLTTNRNLTDGENNDSGRTSQVIFCR